MINLKKISKTAWSKQRLNTRLNGSALPHDGPDFQLHLEDPPRIQGRIPQSDTRGHDKRPTGIDRALSNMYHPWFPAR